MEETRVSFEVAKLLKEINFLQDLFNTGWYNRIGTYLGRTNINEEGITVVISNTYSPPDVIIVSKEEYEECTSHKYIAPTQSLAQKWFREVHGIFILVDCFEKASFKIHRKGVKSIFSVTDYSTYEESLEEGLKQACLIIK